MLVDSRRSLGAMRYIYFAPTVALLALQPYFLYGASTLVLPAANVGSNLETSVSIRTDMPVPAAGLDITVASSDPAKLLFSSRQDRPGTASLVVRVRRIAAGNSDIQPRCRHGHVRQILTESFEVAAHIRRGQD